MNARILDGKVIIEADFSELALMVADMQYQQLHCLPSEKRREIIEALKDSK